MVIYKYPILITDSQFISIPMECEILSVKEQNGGLVLYCMVNDKTPNISLEIQVFGTGHSFDSHGEYIDTVMMPNGLVWHVFYNYNL